MASEIERFLLDYVIVNEKKIETYDIAFSALTEIKSLKSMRFSL